MDLVGSSTVKERLVSFIGLIAMDFIFVCVAQAALETSSPSVLPIARCDFISIGVSRVRVDRILHVIFRSKIRRSAK